MSDRPAGGFGELLEARAREQPTALAFRFVEADGAVASTLTRAEVHDRTARAATGLLQIATPGARAVLMFGPGLEFVQALLACLTAGIVAVPLPPPLGPEAPARLDGMVADADPIIGLTTKRLAPRIARLASQAPAFARVAWRTIEDLFGIGKEPLGRVNLADLALLLYTSGSTGTPKGVCLTHANLLSNAAQAHHAFGEPRYGHDRMVCWLPAFHDMGLMSGVIGPIVSGIDAVLLSPLAVAQHPARWLDAIGRFGATLSGAPGFAYDECVSRIPEERRRELNLAGWRVAFCGAEPIRLDTLDRFAQSFAASGFRRSAFLPCYGLAEATVAVSASREASPVALTADSRALEAGALVESTGNGRALVACGRPLPGVDVRVVDAADGRECPPDRIGEIWIAGENVAAGYWRQPELSRLTFEARLADGRGPFLRTGDLGFLRDGRLFVAGRAKELIIVRGRNYYPHDLEATAERNVPSSARGGTVAIAVESPEGGERIVIVQELRREAHTDAERICAAIRTAIAEEHAIAPFAVVVVDRGRLPKTTSGKIRRQACRALITQNNLDVVAAWCADPAYSGLTWNTGKYDSMRPAE